MRFGLDGHGSHPTITDGGPQVLTDHHSALPAGLLGTFWVLAIIAAVLGVGGWLLTLGGHRARPAAPLDPANQRPRRWSKRVVDEQVSRSTGTGSGVAPSRRSRSRSDTR